MCGGRGEQRRMFVANCYISSRSNSYYLLMVAGSATAGLLGGFARAACKGMLKGCRSGTTVLVLPLHL